MKSLVCNERMREVEVRLTERDATGVPRADTITLYCPELGAIKDCLRSNFGNNDGDSAVGDRAPRQKRGRKPKKAGKEGA